MRKLEECQGIVEEYAKKQKLFIEKTEDGWLELKKKFSENNIACVVMIKDADDCIVVNVYQAGPGGFLTSASKELCEPIQRKGIHVVLINRDIQDESIGGLIVYDTRKEGFNF